MKDHHAGVRGEGKTTIERASVCCKNVSRRPVIGSGGCTKLMLFLHDWCWVNMSTPDALGCMQNALKGSCLPFTLMLDRWDAAWSKERSLPHMLAAISLQKSTTACGVLMSWGMVSLLRLSASEMTASERGGSHTGQHTTLALRHNRNICSASFCTAGVDEPNRIALTEPLLSQAKMTLRIAGFFRMMAFRQRKIPKSSHSVLLSCCSIAENIARNMSCVGSMVVSPGTRRPPPAAVCDAS